MRLTTSKSMRSGWRETRKEIVCQRHPLLATLGSHFLSGVIALASSALAPPRNPPKEFFIAQPVTDIFQPLVGPLPFQIGQRFLHWHILSQRRQFAEKQ